MLACCLVCSLILSAGVSLEAWQDIDVKAVGLTVAQKDENSEYGGSVIPGLNPGTTVHVHAHSDKLNILSLEFGEDESFTMTDSTGKSLDMSDSNMEFYSDISEDGHTALIPVSSPEVPASGTDSISIKGAVTLVCGANPKTESFDVKIAAGEVLEIAGIKFKVDSIEDSFMNDDGEMVNLETNSSPAQIESIEAILANGKSVEFSPSGSSQFGFNDNITYGKSYDLSCKASEIAQLKVTWFQDVKRVELPIEIKAGLGF